MPEPKLEVCPNPVFIIGAPRSGTSVLGWALAQHSHLWTSRELDLLFNLYGKNHLWDAYAAATSRPEGNWLFEHGVHYRELFAYLGLGINALFTSKSGGKRWVEQTPVNTFLAEVLFDMFPGAQFIHMLRDGRDVVHSMMNFYKRFPGKSREELIESGQVPDWGRDFRHACNTWALFVTVAVENCGRFPERCLTVRHHELAKDPDAGFQKICAFLREPYEEKMADFYRSNRINSSFTPDAWTAPDAAAKSTRLNRIPDPWKGWNEEQRKIFLEEAGAAMALCGMPVTEAKPLAAAIPVARPRPATPVIIPAAPANIEHSPSEPITFRCNVCGATSVVPFGQLDREDRSCSACGSTVRWRSIVHALSTELFGSNLALPDFPTRKDIRGIGMTDWDGYAVPLAAKLDYHNTFLHQQPKLDITAIPADLEHALDFVISSDVFENVPQPVSVAFENLLRLLKPGGVAILSVHYDKVPFMREHFPELHDWHLAEESGRTILKNTTRDGRAQVFDNLVFHGGPGNVLEMRRFGEAGLLQNLVEAGFVDIKLFGDDHLETGIAWKYKQSLPVSARAPQAPNP